MTILGIETSCDETAAAVVENGKTLLSNVVASQIDIHTQYGGVVPEVAARSHIEAINAVINQALDEAGVAWDDIDAIGVTVGAGLSGSLLIGSLAARTLAIINNKPIYGANHVLGHLYVNFLDKNLLSSRTTNYELPATKIEFPVLGLIVSGGHSQLVLFTDYFEYKILGQAIDDAVGEAFDKVARIIGLGYPGGPKISKAAEQGDPHKYRLPISKLDNKYDFSFSGLKTATLRQVQAISGVDHSFPSFELAERLNEQQVNDIAASFEYTAVKTLVNACKLAFDELNPKSFIIGGGVAANTELRRQLKETLPLEIDYPPINLCTDNAAMIAALTYYQAKHQEADNPHTLEVNPVLKM